MVAQVSNWEGRTLAERFLVGERLGSGGMAVIHRAHDRLLHRDVAIKLLRTDQGRTDDHRRRLFREARAVARLNHPHIVTVHDVGMVGDVVYIVMELLVGASVDTLLDNEGQLPVPLSLEIGRQVASALAAAHGQRVIHRDVKPDNIFVVASVSGAITKLLDFSVAKVKVVDAARLTAEGAIFGTPHYMSPEQATGASVSPQTDIYALGVVLHEVLSGHPPFDADSVVDLFEMHISAPIPRLCERTLGLPPGLADLLVRMLAKRPEDRPASALALSNTLSDLLDATLALRWQGPRGHDGGRDTEVGRELDASARPAGAAADGAAEAANRMDATVPVDEAQVARSRALLQAEREEQVASQRAAFRATGRVSAPGAIARPETIPPKGRATGRKQGKKGSTGG